MELFYTACAFAQQEWQIVGFCSLSGLASLSCTRRGHPEVLNSPFEPSSSRYRGFRPMYEAGRHGKMFILTDPRSVAETLGDVVGTGAGEDSERW